MTKRVAIIGAGVSGMTCAHALEARGAAVTVFEASARAGGPIRSVRRDGYLAECGPHTLMESSGAITDLVRSLGLEGDRIYAAALGSRRFVLRDGVPQPLPSSPPALLRTKVFSGRAKLALLREPFVPRRDDGLDESVAMFARRRLDPELLDYGLELLVNGVWAGDPNRLSARYAFPKMFALERDFGSLLRGAIARGRRGSAPRRMFSFRHGNQQLVDGLAASLGDLRLQTPVGRVERRDGRWHLDVADDAFDAVVSTVAAPAYGELDLRDGDKPVDVDFMDGIDAPPLAVVTLGFRRADVAHSLDGFGMIAPIREGVDVLGVLFTSSLYDGRAPEDHVTLACFVGGARRGELARLEPAQRLDRTLGALRATLGVRGDPTFVHETVYERAIPQYEVGYGRILARMEALEHRHRGLYIAGNIRGSVAVPDLVDAAPRLASQIVGES